MRRSHGQPPRFELDLRRKGIPSVPVFGRYHYARAMPGLETHRHPGAIEICHLVRGRQIYEVGGRRYCLRGGDLFLTFPGEAHGTGGEPEEKGLLYWMTLLDPALTGASLLGLPPTDSRALWSALRAIQRGGRRHFTGGEMVRHHLDTVAGLLHQPWNALRRVTAGNHLCGFLLAVLDRHEHATRKAEDGCLQKVFAAIASELEGPESLTIAALAEVAGLSPSRFQAKFKQETGMPPAEFVLRARIAEAERRLVRPGATVTRVAMDLGFSSSQYFSVSFRRFTNRKPSELLRRE